MTSGDFKARWREVAAYDYTTPDGRVAFAHVRLASRHPSGIDPEHGEAKRFNYATVVPHPCSPAPPRWVRARDGHSGWDFTLRSLADEWRHVPYKLHWVKAWAERSDTQPLWVVEGEKDAHALYGLKLWATTAHGAAGAWTSEETQCLVDVGWRGQINVVIDDDGPGFVHGVKTLAALGGGFLEGGLVAGVFKAAEGNDAHDAIVTAGLGVGSWAVPVPLDELHERAEAWKATNAGGNGGGDGGYRHSGKQAEIQRLIEEGDW
jgi:hypothetical protein